MALSFPTMQFFTSRPGKLCLVLFLISFTFLFELKFDLIRSKLRSQPTSINDTHEEWSFDWKRDGTNHLLTTAQCDAAFPHLYYEIDRAARHWQNRNITEETLRLERSGDGGVRVLIHSNSARVISTWRAGDSFWGFRTRAILSQIHRAVASFEETLPDVEFVVSVADFARPTVTGGGRRPAFAFSRKPSHPEQDSAWLVPDFNFWSSKADQRAFTEKQARAREHDSPLTSKVLKLFWRGVAGTGTELRHALLRSTRGVSWADVETMSWGAADSVVPPENFCDYAFLMYTEGTAYSSRLTYMLNCDSVPVVHEDRDFVTHYDHLLEADVNYVPIQRNFSDLESQMTHYLSTLDAAERIAENARKTFRERYTTPAAGSCYWRRLLRVYADVAFVPETRSGFIFSRNRGITVDHFLKDYKDRDYESEIVAPRQ